jgi:hypothetical protein
VQHIILVALITGGKIIQPYHALAQLQQVRADEAGYSGN